MNSLKSCIVFCLVAASVAEAQDRVAFSRHIQPLLSDKCYKCHGPDKAKRTTELRLDNEKSAFAELDGHRAIVPGSLAKSELYKRITSKDADERMPPADSGLALSDKEVELIRRWIEQGAKWQQHWSFVPPKRPLLPAVPDRSVCVNEIDFFVQSKLAAMGWKPTKGDAPKTTLIRRATLDLTGVPPTTLEVDRFLRDQAPGAYERLLDRLLSSPRYGERMANRWLDAARYADTSGYQNDGPRYMWRWRDWVVEALNRNMPFDQFTIEQLAGDLLPNPSLEQRIASGFNRNHRGNAEGGIIPEEYAVEYVVDRVDTTATVWLGLTMGCARCHDHKYDPISQKEFYQVFAYFNNLPEYGRAIKEGNSPPFIKAPTRLQRREYAALSKRLERAQEQWLAKRQNVADQQRVWETADHKKLDRKLDGKKRVMWNVDEGLYAHFPLDGEALDRIGKKPGKPHQHFAAGRLDRAAKLDGKTIIDGGDVAKLGYFDKFSLTAWVHPRQLTGTVVSRMVHEHRGKGYYVHLEKGKIQVNLVSRWLDDSLRVESNVAIPKNQWSHIGVVYDGSRVGKAITIYVNGQRVDKTVLLDGLNQTFALDEPLRIGGGSANYTGLIDDLRIYDRELTSVEVATLSTHKTIQQIIALPPEKRSRSQRIKLGEYYRLVAAPAAVRQEYSTLLQLVQARKEMVESWPTVMVMQERENRRPTFILKRGQYDLPQAEVKRGVPASLLAVNSQPKSRLDFARWLVSADNPLTARVTVNRYWQMLFGRGLVRTAEDFGSQGERPTHPALLDWLAVEYRQNGWDTKRLLKTIMMSATYRRGSHGDASSWNRDLENKWLARGPRVRLPAETLRNQALSAAGLLTERLGGPSVKPYQPDGLWQEIATDTNYDQSHGADLYRRGLYTYWKRTVAPPMMSVFDSSSREMCVVRQATTNTPLQALATLNEITFVEASRALAVRVIKQRNTQEQRLRMMFRLVLARSPSKSELNILQKGLARHLAHYSSHRKQAAELLKSGELEHPADIDGAELAAYATMANLILNLDEAITKD